MLVIRVRAFAAAFIVVLAVGLGVAGVVATAAARTPAAHHKSVKKAHRKAARHKRRRRHGKRRKHVKRTHATLASAAKKKRGGGGTGGTGGTGTGSNTPSIYWGASIGSQLTGSQAPWDMSAVSDVAAESGKGLSLVHFGTPFASCSSTTTSSCSDESFPTTPFNNIRNYGAIPFLDWSSVADDSSGTSSAEPSTLAAVINGDWDSYITSFAEAAKAWGHPFFLRFDWEMNGNWFPWSEGVNGNTAGQYVAAWRHVHDIFEQVGATNVSWVWCPNVDFANKLTSLQELYPGNSYVDWTCLDGYNWGSNSAGASSGDGWQSFDQIFQSTYNEIVNTVAPGKPMIIGEVGSTEDGGSKASWISNMLSDIPTNYPDIHGLMYFDRYDNGMDWPIETSATSIAAWDSGISQQAAYVPNNYSGLSTSPIPVPSV